MAISFNKALGLHDSALIIRSKRSAILANNLANSDTPGFKARDINFNDVLSSMEGLDRQVSSSVKRTHASHLDPFTDPFSDEHLKYRHSLQPSADNNTVDALQEQARFSENLMRMQASFRFLNGKFSGIQSALRGE